MILFVGDVAVLYASLYSGLFLRQLTLPSRAVWEAHVLPFSILSAVWIIVFFIAGLYEKHTTLLKSRLPSIIFHAQLVNSALAILFFYLIPYFGITPKTLLFIYLLVSFALIVLWRRYALTLLSARTQQPAILIGSGREMHELMREVNGNPRYGIRFISSLDVDDVEGIDFQSDIVEQVYGERVTTIVVDTKDERVLPILPKLYNLIFSGIRFIDMHKVYEDTFDRIPLSLLTYDWFLEHLSSQSKVAYGALKRLVDLLGALALGLLTALALPLVAVAIKLDDGGPVFVVQERVGRYNRHFFVRKFRTMRESDDGVWHEPDAQVATRVGKLLRRSSIDELPQFLNVLRGEMSLIGPRSDIVGIATKLAEEITYYHIRHVVKPGITGWAQTHQRYAPGNISPQSIEEARVRLAYDLYYVKNRSILLDVRIALQTLGTLIARFST